MGEAGDAHKRSDNERTLRNEAKSLGTKAFVEASAQFTPKHRSAISQAKASTIWAGLQGYPKKKRVSLRVSSGTAKKEAQRKQTVVSAMLLLRENERLRKENRILREEREVLKKAAMFFAAQKP